VSLSPGAAYIPVGGELSAPQDAGNAAVRPASAEFYVGARRAAVLAYVINGSHYVRLSDLAGTLNFAAACDGEKHAAEISTAPSAAPAGVTGEAIDQIAFSSADNSWSVDSEGRLTIYLNRGVRTIEAPLTLNPSEMKYAGSEAYPGVFLSDEKIAVACGGTGGDPVYVVYSDDLGATWKKSDAVSGGVGVSCLYIGFVTPSDGWLVLGSFHGMGSEDNFVYRTADGGKSWAQTGNPNDIYSRMLTGAGFSNPEPGFLCFRVEFSDFSPAGCRTRDGGLTWEKFPIALPGEFDRYESKTPLSPVFSGASGVLPIKLESDDGNSLTVCLTSGDYGRTWAYDEGYDLARRWAQAVKSRDGRAQYELLSESLKAELYDGYVSFNWVTGTSSPWVDRYTVTAGPDGAVIDYTWASSTGPDGSSRVALSFVRENGALRIGGISDSPDTHGLR
jgi:photosystem II stability/assembly factor-like uncharacterized protein